MKLSDLDFGAVTAEVEAANKDTAVLLTKGFFDPEGHADRVWNQEVTVLLGSKGSGKSAVLEHLRLREQYDTFLRRIHVGDLPFHDFAKIKFGDTSPETRAPTVWKFFLLAYLLESLSADPHLGLEGGTGLVRESLDYLEQQGVRPGKDLRESVLKLSRLTMKITLPFSVGGVESTIQRQTTDRVFLGTAGEYLVRLVERVRSTNRHILFIDGLDDFYRPSVRDQDDVIAGLIFAGYHLNQRFRESGSPCSVAIACRTEIFDRLPLSMTSAIKNVRGASIDWSWRDDVACESLLFELVNHKVAAKSPKITGDVVSTYFPPQVPVGSQGRELDTYEYLLDRTRRTPRDILRLFSFIARRLRTGGNSLSAQDVVAGARDYARDYFYGEVRSELTATCDKQESETVLNTITQLDGHIFTKAQLLVSLPSLRRSLSSVLEGLFQAGALGYTSGPEYYNFRYRNEAVGFNEDAPLVLHNSMITAMNVPRGRASTLNRSATMELPTLRDPPVGFGSE